ncbi:tetraprenyl-beta-curcumene synthase family protein [Alicyclobacillus fastidiosus]|uniref:Tetraprenyl-beta-curcumene synthase family protein n=1 Tax=Alicyclobacillus fastidiosus TaxID=392011 RepID=A0ABY6ZDR7_9BACL|nr:tetraprenyl-beta-curcumene synthase family protein [Alicyclobacillus fastidiosus]WAH40870.1 tetraprenyl-beta-curcumene synthase family protein [Alicyclobacillus fastidiosus]
MTTATPRRPTLFLYRLFHDVMPLARQQIQRWTALAEAIPHEELRQQALSSLAHKRFHADGGSVYAAANRTYAATLVELIVALQTISDYLDNLCDRCDRYDATDFHRLHDAMRDAVVPDAPLRDYYAFRGHPDDGGYLPELVRTCQRCVRTLPNYHVVQGRVSWYVERYSELQEHKHIDPKDRQQTLIEWSAPFVEQNEEIAWWEFASATGSTLGMFSLFLAATEDVDEATVEETHGHYFPWICGLHILLDYLIDLDEDAREGDFNFVACYRDEETARERIFHFAAQSWRRAKRISYGGRIHRFVVQGLLGMYLSDDKVRLQPSVKKARRMVYRFGPTACMFYFATVLYRRIR